MPSVVSWIGNTPQQFGYEIHTNIIAHPPTIKPELRHSVYSKYNISGQPVEFCYNNEDEIFDADHIIEALESKKELNAPQEVKDISSAVSIEVLETESNNNI